LACRYWGGRDCRIAWSWWWLLSYYSYEARDYSGDEECSTADEDGKIVGACKHVASEDREEAIACRRGGEYGADDNHHYSKDEDV